MVEESRHELISCRDLGGAYFVEPFCRFYLEGEMSQEFWELIDSSGLFGWKETKTQLCLLCEVILRLIPAFNFFCASFESITAIEKLGKWWDFQLGNYTWVGGDSRGGGDVLPKVLLVLQGKDGGKHP
ncbi:hypothetical protein Tco_0007066 [Tanacetum coccineum]